MSDEAENETPRTASAQTERDSPGAQDQQDQGAAVDPTNASARDAMFELYKGRLDDAKWDYKSKTGPDRDVSYKTVVLAERAYVSASIYDHDRATEMFEKSNGRPPSPELLKRAKDAQVSKRGTSIDDLTAGIASLKDQNEKASRDQEISSSKSQLGSWQIALGDAEERSRKHRRAANEELLKGEREDPSGLHILTAVKKGLAAGSEYRDMFKQRARAKENRDNIRDHHILTGKIKGSTKTFSPEKTVAGGPTSGPVGKIAARFAGTTKIVEDVLGRMKMDEASKAAKPDVAPNVATVLQRNQQQGQDRGIGM